MLARWWSYLVGEYSIWGIVLMLLLVVLLGFELWRYAVTYARIPKYRNRATSTGAPISVVAVLRDVDERYLYDTLPKIFEQEYPDFELVVVDIAGDEFFSHSLQLIEEHNPRFVVSRVARSKNIRISDRLAFNIGIKTARYENIILTTAYSEPATKYWLASFGKAFDTGASVVLGYSNVDYRRGFANRLMRIDIFTGAVRWLSAAISGRPYRGTIHNLGLKRALYFEVGGFNYLSQKRGIEDLFVQKIANKENTTVVTSPYGKVQSDSWGGTALWLSERVTEDYSKKFYNRSARRASSTSLIVRGLFFVAVIVTSVLLPIEIMFGTFGLYLIRLIVVLGSLNKIRRRLGEKRLMMWFPIYDLVAPFYELSIRVARILKPSSRWR